MIFFDFSTIVSTPN